MFRQLLTKAFQNIITGKIINVYKKLNSRDPIDFLIIVEALY